MQRGGWPSRLGRVRAVKDAAMPNHLGALPHRECRSGLHFWISNLREVHQLDRATNGFAPSHLDWPVNELDTEVFIGDDVPIVDGCLPHIAALHHEVRTIDAGLADARRELSPTFSRSKENDFGGDQGAPHPSSGERYGRSAALGLSALPRREKCSTSRVCQPPATAEALSTSCLRRSSTAGFSRTPECPQHHVDDLIAHSSLRLRGEPGRPASR